MSCVACHSQDIRSKLRKGEIEILECPRCGLAWWTPSDDFDPRATYDSNYFDSVLHGHGYDDYASLADSLRKTFSARLSRLLPPRADSRLLDVGAAHGFAVTEAAALDWRAFGLEISLDAAGTAATKNPSRIAVGVGEHTPFASGSFDAVTAWDVLEHLSGPREFLAEAHRVLRPGGVLALTTGDVGSWMARVSGARWHLYTLPEHLYFYSRASLRSLLCSEGFEVRRITSEGAYYTLGYLVERFRKTILRSHSTAGRGWPGAGICIPLNLFDIVLVEARRR